LHKMKLRTQSIEPGNNITSILTLEMFRELNQLILPGRRSRHCQTEDGRNILGDTMAVYRGLHFDLATDISIQRLGPPTLKNDVGSLFFMSGFNCKRDERWANLRYKNVIQYYECDQCRIQFDVSMQLDMREIRSFL